MYELRYCTVAIAVQIYHAITYNHYDISPTLNDDLNDDFMFVSYSLLRYPPAIDPGLL